VPTVGQDVAEALRLAAPAVAQVDATGGPNGCLTTSAAPDPVVYRNDRIVLRSALNDVQIRNRVDTALASVGSPGAAGAIERIAVPAPAAAAAAPVSAGRDAGVASSAGAAVEADELPIVVVTITHGSEPVKIVPLARRLRSLTPPITASPDYLLSPTPPVGMWPRGFPQPTTVVQQPRAATIGDEVDIWVYDAGLPSETDGNWAPNVSRLTPDDVEHLDVVQPGKDVVDIYSGGHTLAIADVIATIAPAAKVKAVRITDSTGVATDVSAARRMARTLSGIPDWPELILNAFGSPTCNQGGSSPHVDLAPIGLEAVAEAVGRQDDVVLVASAGNRASQRPFYPAAFDTATAPLADAVLGVGALDTTLATDGTAWTSSSRTSRIADFSNSGVWVEAWTPGVDLSARHVRNLRFQASDPKIYGMALNSGTSFSAPYLTGLLAEVIGRSPATNRLTPREAWEQLAASGRPCPAGGGGVALALTSMTALATTTANSTRNEC
jgi:hypothetical protein